MRVQIWEGFISILIVGMLCVSVQSIAAELQGERQTVAEDAYRALFTVRNADELHHLVQQWAKGLSLTELDSLLHLCWEHISATVPIEMPVEVEKVKTHHNINLKGGRCAWIFEQLTQHQLPPVTRLSSQEDLAYIRNQAFEEIIKIQNMQRAVERLLVKAAIPQNREEKIRLASDPATMQIVLMALADDQDADIRLAIATNPHAFPRLRHLAEHDPDMRVREAALKNLQCARMLSNVNFEKERLEDFLAMYPVKTLRKLTKQPAILPFDLVVEERLSTARSAWRAGPSIRSGESGPQTLEEAVDYLVKSLNLPAPPAFCTEDADTFYCSESTSLAQGADFSSGFAIEKGGTTIYSWDAPQE